MKNVSILDVLQGLHNVTEVTFYSTEDVLVVDGDSEDVVAKKEAMKSDCFLVIEKKDDEGAVIQQIGYRLNQAGKLIADIGATIDAINGLDMVRHTRVLSQYSIGEYSILTALKCLIRPKKAVVTGNTEGSIPMKDILEGYKPIFSEGKGEILSPEEFELAQLKLLRIINKKCVSLSNVEKVSRDTVTLGESDYLVYPVRVNGDLVAVSKSQTFRIFPITLKVYDDEEYVLDYTHKYVSNKFEQVAVDILKAANTRSGKATEEN